MELLKEMKKMWTQRRTRKVSREILLALRCIAGSVFRFQMWVVFVVLICIHSPCLTLGIQRQRRSGCVACECETDRVFLETLFLLLCTPLRWDPFPRSKFCVKRVFTIFMCLRVVGPKPEPAPCTSLECPCIHRLAPGANPRARSGSQSSAQKSCHPRSAHQLVTQEMVPHLGGSLEPPGGPVPGLPVLM